jgi:hypothetical protein
MVTLSSSKGDVPGSGTFALKMRAGGSMQVVAPCPITAGESDVYSKTVSSLIINNGSALAAIKQIEIVWPSSNGLLRQIEFGDSQIWAGGEEPPSWTIHKPDWKDTPGILEIAGETQKKLALGFENIAASDKDLYSIEVIFDNGCTVNWP